jgi:hypothetical protein
MLPGFGGFGSTASKPAASTSGGLFGTSGSGSAPISFSFGSATGPSTLTRGLSGTSTVSGEGGSDKGAASSQETLVIKSQDSSAGQSHSQSQPQSQSGTHDGDVAPEVGTGLALGEDKFDQPGPGEENEESLFTVRGKVMKFSGSNWMDMGIGKSSLLCE